MKGKNQKNPLISKFFLQLGWVEEIGSGIYNINRYLPLYSPGSKATFNEDVIFTTTIPIRGLDDLQMQEMIKTTPQDEKTTPQLTPQDEETTPQVIKLLEVLHGEMSREEIQVRMELKDRENLRKVYIKPALELGFIELTIPDKPSSKKQKYRLTGKGKLFLKKKSFTGKA